MTCPLPNGRPLETDKPSKRTSYLVYGLRGGRRWNIAVKRTKDSAHNVRKQYAYVTAYGETLAKLLGFSSVRVEKIEISSPAEGDVPRGTLPEMTDSCEFGV